MQKPQFFSPSLTVLAAYRSLRWQVAADHLLKERYILQSALVLGSSSSIPDDDGGGKDWQRMVVMEEHHGWTSSAATGSSYILCWALLFSSSLRSQVMIVPRKQRDLKLLEKSRREGRSLVGNRWLHDGYRHCWVTCRGSIASGMPAWYLKSHTGVALCQCCLF